MSEPSLHNESTLLGELAAGSEAAFSELYNFYYKRVLYFARRYVSEADAQDVTAETFIQLWRKRSGFDHLKGLSSFLFITARNRCFDLLRHNEVKNLHQQALTEMVENNTDDGFQLEEIRMELVQLLQQQLDKLPVRMREVFMLSFQEGLKPAQIAERLQLSVKTVKNQKLSAVKLLKAALSQHPLKGVLLLLVQMELLQKP